MLDSVTSHAWEAYFTLHRMHGACICFTAMVRLEAFKASTPGLHMFRRFRGVTCNSTIGLKVRPLILGKFVGPDCAGSK